ncbi:hypothetical protein N9355_09040 [Crocinitomicaceae bacterium]|nr:hypothetical protein [Crocinitomicaceae bacterium]
MFFLAYIVLPLLILGNLTLGVVNIYKKKMHLVTVVICLIIPVVVYYVHTNYFPEEMERGLITFVRYPENILVQSIVNSVIFAILKFANGYEKNPRRNYYRDKEDPPKEDSMNEELLDN